MMGLFLSRALILILGYVHPAYECFKVVEKNGPEIDQLLFWCHYWIFVAMFTICERVGDNLISWSPLYNVAKVAFIVCLWYPKTKGADYVYESVFRPLMAKYETEIHKRLLGMEAKVGEIATAYWRRGATHGQAKLVEPLHHVSSQSASQRHTQKAKAASGLAVDDDSKLKFLELKAKRTFKFIVFKIEEKQKQVVVEKLGVPTDTYDDFAASLPADECRYAVYDFDYVTGENCQESRIVFIAWFPDTARVRSKMIYASSKYRFKRELDGIQVELRATDPSEMELDVIARAVEVEIAMIESTVFAAETTQDQNYIYMQTNHKN